MKKTINFQEIADLLGLGLDEVRRIKSIHVDGDSAMFDVEIFEYWPDSNEAVRNHRGDRVVHTYRIGVVR